MSAVRWILLVPVLGGGGLACQAGDPAPTQIGAPPGEATIAPAPAATIAPEDRPTQPLRPYAPGPPAFRRLLASEYAATIEDLLGPEAAAAATAPADVALNGFDAVGATQLATNEAAVRTYEASARAIAAIAAQGGRARVAYTACEPLSPDAADCFYELVERFGRRAFRRSLAPDEIARWVRVGQAAAQRLDSFDAGVEWVIAGMLQSPSFLYRSEVGDQGELDATELATRLAYFLTGAGPDVALLDAAERGELDDEAGMRRHAERLIESPRAREALEAFLDEVLRLRDLAGAVKNPDLYPAFGEALAASMRAETLGLVEDLVWRRDTDIRELFDASYTFADARLAQLYGIDRERDGSELARVDLPASGPRAGLLGHASFLTLMSHAAATSPTLRGKFIRETLMCQAIPAPPPNVNTTLPDPEPGAPPKTMRERLRQHQADPSCASCHVLMDELGLSLETFDAIGRFRADENGNPIDTSGKLDGRTFQGPRELGRLLRDDRRTTTCMVRNLFRHATGHVEDIGEEPEIAAIADRFAGSGFRLKALLVEIAASKAFRQVREVEQ